MSADGVIGGGGQDKFPPSDFRTVVRDVIAVVSPDELVVVDGLSRLEWRVASKRLRRSSEPRVPLGFGVGEVVALATPIVWLTMEHAAQRFGEVAADGAATGFSRLARKIFRREPAAPLVAPLSSAQLQEVRQSVLDLAAQRGNVDRDRAMTIADAVVARLASSSHSSAEPEPGPAELPPGGRRDA